MHADIKKLYIRRLMKKYHWIFILFFAQYSFRSSLDKLYIHFDCNSLVQIQNIEVSIVIKAYFCKLGSLTSSHDMYIAAFYNTEYLNT